MAVGGGAVIAEERPDVGSNRAAAASAGDSVLVPRVLTEGEGTRAHRGLSNATVKTVEIRAHHCIVFV